MVDVLFALIFACGVGVLVVEVVRTRRHGARWWQVLVEVKTRQQEWPLYLSGMALILIASEGTRQVAFFLLAIPACAYVAWHVMRRGAPTGAGRDDHLLSQPMESAEPTSNVRRVE